MYVYVIRKYLTDLLIFLDHRYGMDPKKHIHVGSTTLCFIGLGVL